MVRVIEDDREQLDWSGWDARLGDAAGLFDGERRSDA